MLHRMLGFALLSGAFSFGGYYPGRSKWSAVIGGMCIYGFILWLGR